MYTRNTAYIPPNWKDIRNAYMNGLSEIGLRGGFKNRFKKEEMMI